MTFDKTADDFRNESSFGKYFLVNVANIIDECDHDFLHVNDINIRNDLIELVENYKPMKMKETNFKMNVALKDDISVSQRSRRLPFAEQKIVDKHRDEWLYMGVIKPSYSEYASPILLCKKRDGTHRLVVDFRQLNKKVLKDSFPMAQIEEVLDHLGDAKVFSTLDLKSGFFHVPVEENYTKYLAFI